MGESILTDQAGLGQEQRLSEDAEMLDAGENLPGVIDQTEETAMKRESTALRDEKRIAHLRLELEKARAKKVLKFLAELPIRVRTENELQRENILRVVDSNAIVKQNSAT